MGEVGQPTQNLNAERVIRTIQEEEVDLSEYENFHEAYRQIGRSNEEVYMYKRRHSSLGYLTPAKYEVQWRSLLQAKVVDVVYGRPILCPVFGSHYTTPALTRQFALAVAAPGVVANSGRAIQL